MLYYLIIKYPDKIGETCLEYETSYHYNVMDVYGMGRRDEF